MELLTLGSELLTGTVLNTNARYLGRELTRMGFSVHGQSACPDDPQLIREALKTALQRSDIIFVSGGLGPTPDDVTRECLADFFKVPLIFSKIQYRQIVRIYQRRGRRVPALVKREALFPANAKPVFNRFGIALGFVIEGAKILVVLPGVPGELTRLFETHIRFFLRRKFPGLQPVHGLIVKTVGLSEPTVMSRLGKGFFKLGSFQFGIYPEVGEVTLRIYSDTATVNNRLKKWIEKRLGSDIYAFNEASLSEIIGRKLRSRKWSVAIAESCTGGQVSEAITRATGASRYFKGSVVAYGNEVKVRSLDVPRKLIAEKGAVSAEVALAMARGIRKRFSTTLGVSVTGIAGPTGGTKRKPVGLVYLSVSSAKRERVWKEIFFGDRIQIQDRATKKALEHIWRWTRD